MTSVRVRATPLDQVDSLSLFKSGVNFAKRNYALTLFYILGLMVLQFATGFAVTGEQEKLFSAALAKIDIAGLEAARENAYICTFALVTRNLTDSTASPCS